MLLRRLLPCLLIKIEDARCLRLWPHWDDGSLESYKLVVVSERIDDLNTENTCDRRKVWRYQGHSPILDV